MWVQVPPSAHSTYEGTKAGNCEGRRSMRTAGLRRSPLPGGNLRRPYSFRSRRAKATTAAARNTAVLAISATASRPMFFGRNHWTALAGIRKPGRGFAVLFKPIALGNAFPAVSELWNALYYRRRGLQPVDGPRFRDLMAVRAPAMISGAARTDQEGVTCGRGPG
jgi:hypothetical protein